jgi:nuclease S1
MEKSLRVFDLVQMRKGRISLILLTLLWAHNTLAWGNLGHRVTGLIAQAMLTPEASKQVHQLLGEQPLSSAATYMDVQRASLSERWPTADQWHYDNQPVCGKQPDYCRDGNCATRQIERFRKLLADKSIAGSERAMALRLLVHMLGDVHQPLHMSDNADRGGNNLNVRLYSGGQRYRLHEVLDTVLLSELIGQQRVGDYADGLRQIYRRHLSTWQQGDLSSWTQETHLLAVTRVYGALPTFACAGHVTRTITLPDRYVQDARQYLPEQLAKAGARIAAMLNATLE